MNKRILLFLFPLFFLLISNNSRGAAYLPEKHASESCIFITKQFEVKYFHFAREEQTGKTLIKKNIRTKAWYNGEVIETPFTYSLANSVFYNEGVHIISLQTFVFFYYPNSYFLRGPPSA